MVGLMTASTGRDEAPDSPAGPTLGVAAGIETRERKKNIYK